MELFTKEAINPLWNHDCSHCEFIGIFANQLDLYICHSSTTVSLISRSSDEGFDYFSFPLEDKEFEKEFADLKPRYQNWENQKEVRLRILVEMIFRHMPCVLLNLTKFNLE